VRLRWRNHGLPAALLLGVLTAPLTTACIADLACDGDNCGAINSAGLPGAGTSSAIGTGQNPTAGAGGTSSSAGSAMGGVAFGGTSQLGGSPGSSGTSTGGSVSGNGGTAGAASSTGGASGSGSGGTSSVGGSSGASGSSGAAGSAGSGGSATGGSGGSGSVDPYASARQTCVDRVNQLRATKGLGPIARLSSAEACADGQAKKDSQTGTAHSAFDDCVDEVQGWTGVAQNECPGWGSVADTLSGCIDDMWAEGPGGGHYDNMVGGSDFMACGFYTTAAGKVWMVQDFWSK
jgi:hypothetical protein